MGQLVSVCMHVCIWKGVMACALVFVRLGLVYVCVGVSAHVSGCIGAHK